MNQADLDPDLLNQLIDSLVAAMPNGAGNPAAARAALLGMGAGDALSAMLAAQAAAAHYAAMDGFRRAARPDVEDAMAARLRANAAGLARMMMATLRMIQELRAPAATAEAPAAAAPAVRAPRRAATSAAPPAPLAAPAPRPIRTGPSFAVGEPKADVPLRHRLRWEEMTMEQRRIAYGPMVDDTVSREEGQDEGGLDDDGVDDDGLDPDAPGLGGGRDEPLKH